LYSRRVHAPFLDSHFGFISLGPFAYGPQALVAVDPQEDGHEDDQHTKDAQQRNAVLVDEAGEHDGHGL